MALAAVLGACSDPQAVPDDRQVPWDDGPTNRALSFDGLNDYATLGMAGFPAALHAQTWSLWVRTDAVQRSACLLSLRRDQESGLALCLADGALTVLRELGERTILTAASPLSLGTWHQVAYAQEGTTHRLYLDGALVGEVDLSADKRTPTMAWLGTADGYSQFFRGQMDELRIRSEASDATWIEEAARGHAAAEANVVADFGFNESGGLLLRDRSAEHNNGTLGDGNSEYAPARQDAELPISP